MSALFCGRVAIAIRHIERVVNSIHILVNLFQLIVNNNFSEIFV